ncbi:MAG: hypothetical protein LBL06_05975 [Treponema sp.]|jgi:hypothetical protein|nr:hypothetical protein [Treponema sp.]
MEDKDVLQHLLKVEAEAASLANDAAMEADRRIASSEKQNYLHYEEQFAKASAECEAKYNGDIAAVQVSYQQKLDVFRHGLDSMREYKDGFNRLMESFLF